MYLKVSILLDHQEASTYNPLHSYSNLKDMPMLHSPNQDDLDEKYWNFSTRYL